MVFLNLLFVNIVKGELRKILTQPICRLVYKGREEGRERCEGNFVCVFLVYFVV